jgi:hypothetical protein
VPGRGALVRLYLDVIDADRTSAAVKSLQLNRVSLVDSKGRASSANARE